MCWLEAPKKKCTSKSTCLPMANWISNAQFETWHIELQLNSPTKTQHTPNPQLHPSSSEPSRGAARSLHVPCAAVQQLSAAFRILPSNATRPNLLRWTPPTRRRSGEFVGKDGWLRKNRQLQRWKWDTHLHILGRCCQTFLTDASTKLLLGNLTPGEDPDLSGYQEHLDLRFHLNMGVEYNNRTKAGHTRKWVRIQYEALANIHVSLAHLFLASRFLLVNHPERNMEADSFQTRKSDGLSLILCLLYFHQPFWGYSIWKLYDDPKLPVLQTTTKCHYYHVFGG